MQSLFRLPVERHARIVALLFPRQDGKRNTSVAFCVLEKLHMSELTRLSCYIVGSLILNRSIEVDMEHPDTPELIYWAIEATQKAIVKALPELDIVALDQLHQKLTYPTLH